MLLANFNRKEHVRHRAISLRQHGFLVVINFSGVSDLQGSKSTTLLVIVTTVLRYPRSLWYWALSIIGIIGLSFDSTCRHSTHHRPFWWSFWTKPLFPAVIQCWPATAKHIVVTVTTLTVTWSHGSRDHSTRHRLLPVGGPLELSLYLWRFPRYSATNFMRSQKRAEA